MGSIAIPAILCHAQVSKCAPWSHAGLEPGLNEKEALVQKITTGALGFELAAVGILGSTAVAYDYLSSQDSYY